MSRIFTVVWAVLIIVPAIMFSRSEGSILETLSKVGSYFVGAKLSMYMLGFFSKHTTERGLLIGVAVGFGTIWYVATYTDIAWPWYCAIGASVNMTVSWLASLALDGRQAEYSPYSVQGQKIRFRQEDLAERDDGWYRVPGRVDRSSWWLLAFFGFCLLFLFTFDALIH
jgi:SSS family solute:Na+ symporter